MKARIKTSSIQIHGPIPDPRNPYGQPRFRARLPSEVVLRIEGETYRYDLSADGRFDGMRVAEVLAELAATVAQFEKTAGELRLPAHPADASLQFVGLNLDCPDGHIQALRSEAPFDIVERILGNPPPPTSLRLPPELLGLSGKTPSDHPRHGDPEYPWYGRPPLMDAIPHPFPCDPIFGLRHWLFNAVTMPREAIGRISSGLSPSEQFALATSPGGADSHGGWQPLRFPADGYPPAVFYPQAGPCLPGESKGCDYCGGQPQWWDADRRMMVDGGVCDHCGAGGRGPG